jgi:hypothetical protein
MDLDHIYIVRKAKQVYETMHTLSPVVMFALPSASLADKEPIPSDGSTANNAHY